MARFKQFRLMKRVKLQLRNQQVAENFAKEQRVNQVSKKPWKVAEIFEVEDKVLKLQGWLQLQVLRVLPCQVLKSMTDLLEVAGHQAEVPM